MAFFTQKLGIPFVLAFLAIIAEFFGGLGLLAGLISRVAALGIACNMLVAIAMFHIHNGFFMNWFGTQQGEGIEFHLLALALALTVMVRGAGAYSLDRASSASGPNVGRAAVRSGMLSLPPSPEEWQSTGARMVGYHPGPII